MKRKIIWPHTSKLQLHNAYDHIKKDSLQNADRVRAAIVNSTASLTDHPNKYPADKFKLNNDGSFRAYELFHYRIAYQVTDTEIIIVRVRHTSMEPSGY